MLLELLRLGSISSSRPPHLPRPTQPSKWGQRAAGGGRKRNNYLVVNSQFLTRAAPWLLFFQCEYTLTWRDGGPSVWLHTWLPITISLSEPPRLGYFFGQNLPSTHRVRRPGSKTSPALTGSGGEGRGPTRAAKPQPPQHPQGQEARGPARAAKPSQHPQGQEASAGGRQISSLIRFKFRL